MTDDKLNHLLGLVPERSFVLLEDVDSAFSRRVQTSEDGSVFSANLRIRTECYGSFKSSVTFSGLLNALDGVASSEERIIFMTTNHFSRLDPALIRPGRVDVQEFLNDAVGEQAERLFNKFYGSSHTDEEAAALVEMGREVGRVVDDEWAQGREVSMASLQGLFIRSEPEESLQGLRELCRPREAGGDASLP